jgi:hypothetical protein
MEAIHGNKVVQSFAGADLSAHINGKNKEVIIGPDGKPRNGVLFFSNDSITDLCNNPDEASQGKYDLFDEYVKDWIKKGIGLVPGSVRQPHCVRAFCTGDWKIVRYTDPNGIESDEWELYCLTTDPVEKKNLVNFRTGEVAPEASVSGMSMDELKLKNLELRAELARQEIVTSLGAIATAEHPPLQLYQNYPNPFDQQTTITFYIPESGLVHLSVTDVSGREMQVLVHKILQPGVHQFDLNAGHLSHGIYFLRLNAGSQQMVRKMLKVS